MAGAAFTAMFSSFGLIGAVVGREWNRVRVMAASMIIAATASVCIGLSQSFVQLVLARALQGLSQAMIGPLCSSLISGRFEPASRGKAMAVYNVGIYGGYGCAFAMAALFHPASGSAGHEGWRSMFYAFAGPPVILALLLLFTTRDIVWDKKKEQQRIQAGRTHDDDNIVSGECHVSSSSSDIDFFVVVCHFVEHLTGQSLHQPLISDDTIDSSVSFTASTSSPSPSASLAAVPSVSAAAASAVSASSAPSATVGESFRLLLTTPSLLALCIASAFRNGAGVVWGLNTEQFFENVRDLTPDQISAWMSWVPVVFGSCGALLGGIAADWLLRHYGPNYRIGLLFVGQLLAAPCAAASLLLPHPYAFLLYALFLLIGETYIGTCYAVLMDRTPQRFHSFIVAVYIFFMANLGGNANLLLPPIQSLCGDSMLTALIILYPGFVAIAGLLYGLQWIWTDETKRDQEANAEHETSK